MSYVNNSDSSEKKEADANSIIDFDRLTTLIEAFQFYPMIVKKDRNKSSNIQSILNANKLA
jgi:hypothetical protein